MPESRGDWHKDFDCGEQFADKDKPSTFPLECRSDFCEFTHGEYFHACDERTSVCAGEFVEDDIARHVAERANYCDGYEREVTACDKVSSDDVQHLARRERYCAVRNHEKKNREVAPSLYECLDGDVCHNNILS